MKTIVKEEYNPDLRIIDKMFGADLLPSTKKSPLTIARNLNRVAFIICFADAAYLYVTGIMTKTMPDVITCFLPAALCLVTEIIFTKNKLYAGQLFTFTTVPLAITLKGMYEPLPGLMLFPFTYGIVSFFLLQPSRLVYPIYSLSTICFTITDISYHKKYNQHFNDNISLIIFNDLLFAFLVYTVLGYIRNLLVKFKTTNKRKERELFSQNIELQQQQEQIASQNILLQQRNQLLIESWHVQQKITSILSHDTRTSLIFLKHILLSSKRMVPKTDEAAELIQELEREVSSMTDTFDNILLWLKQPASVNEAVKEEILLQPIAEEIIFSCSMQARKKGVLLENRVDEDAKLYMNPEYLKVILRNLVNNAIKFSKKGGCVIIWSEQSREYFKIFVKDCGVGIAEASLRKIKEGLGFSTAGTMKETGTGMGLVFCRDFINKSNGFMKIISAPEKGTTIMIQLPHGNNRLAVTNNTG